MVAGRLGPGENGHRTNIASTGLDVCRINTIRTVASRDVWLLLARFPVANKATFRAH